MRRSDRSRPNSPILAMLFGLVLFLISPMQSRGQEDHPADVARKTELKFLESADGIEVRIGGELFTCLRTTGQAKPILYPILAPGQIPMTRNWPMQDGSPEPKDHPHHKSLWVGHFINGIDFWTEAQGRVVVDQVQLDAEHQRVIVTSNWISHEQQKICSDETQYRFGVKKNLRFLDVTIKFTADEQDLHFDDTKEGTFAMRTHPNLQLTAADFAGAKTGTARNSEGVVGKEIWGKRARWVFYAGVIDDSDVGIAVFDHPQNLRHPTTWHARDYGLIAANPFGLHEFQGQPAGAGVFRVPQGQSLTLRYRALFLVGKPTDEQINRWYREFVEAD